MKDAAKRIGLEELHTIPKIEKIFGTYESIHKFRHDISHCFIVSIDIKKIDLKNNNNLKLFSKISSNIVPFQRSIIKNWIKESK